jgi:imidazolonepropionase-like amidohydrolase
MLYVRFGDIAYTPERMVDVIGMGNMEAIVACTKTSADCLDIDEETGTIDKGKSADIIVVDGNPNDDIKALHNISTVMLRGDIVKEDGKELI